VVVRKIARRIAKKRESVNLVTVRVGSSAPRVVEGIRTAVRKGAKRDKLDNSIDRVPRLNRPARTILPSPP